MNRIEEINLFFDRLLHSDQYILYGGKEYFIEGCCNQFDDAHQVLSSTLSVFQIPEWEECYTAIASTPNACVNQFVRDFRLDGKNIYELLPNLTIVDK